MLVCLKIVALILKQITFRFEMFKLDLLKNNYQNLEKAYLIIPHFMFSIALIFSVFAYSFEK